MSAESASAVYLAFTTQPGTSGASPYTLSPQPVVAAKKSKGTTDTAKAGTVTISLVVLTGAASLGGTTTKALSSGVADFSANGLTVTATSDATWYLVASLSGLTSATSVTGTTTASGGTGPTVYIADTFDRADDASSIGTASDGGTWTVISGTWGINGNALVNNVADGEVERDAGHSDFTFEVALAHLTNNERVNWRVNGLQRHRLIYQSVDGAMYMSYQDAAGNNTDYYDAEKIFPVDGDVLKIVCSGNSSAVYLNNVLEFTHDGTGQGATNTAIRLTANGTSGAKFDSLTVTA